MLKNLLFTALFAFLAGAAYGQYPATGNKSRLGFQTTGDGLVYRGTLADTTSIKPTGLNNAYFLLDTVNAVLYRYIKTQGGWQEVGGGLEMPFDSVTFVTTYEGTASEGELIWNSQSGTLHLGMAGGIEMPLGQGEAHIVRNVTGSTIAKGKVVYISGATGQRPQISLAEADTEIGSSVTFGITAEEIANNESGFVFTSGYVHGINTSALTEGEALWLDTVAGNFTHDKPTAPVHAVLVGYVITKKNNGTIFVKIQNGYELGELHDVNTQGQAAQDILRYNGTIWQPGKDTSLYNMDARLKGNRLVSMGTADLQFREQAGAADVVQIRPTYVSVENTSTTNNAVLTQYGLQSGSGTIPNNVLSQIYLNGEFSVYTNAATTVPGTEPDLYIDGNGKTKFRVSAAGALDSLYGKTATGHLTAIKNTLGDTVLYIERKDTAAMLQPYLRKADTLSMLSTYISNADTAAMLSTYINNADTSVFARDVQISGTAGQVTYFNGANTVTSDTAFRWSAANKSLGINMTAVPSGANLIIKNSAEPSRSTFLTTQTFAADTTNWTRGAGWTFSGGVAVATAATGDLTYTPALTIVPGNAYEITYTVTGYTAGTLTARIGNGSLALPTHNISSNVILIAPTNATGGFRFTTSTFTGNLDNVSIIQVANRSPILFAAQDDNSTTQYDILSAPNNTSISLIGGGRYATGTNNVFVGEAAGISNTTGIANNFFGSQAGQNNTTGQSNNFFGNGAGFANTIGQSNNFFGNSAGASNTTGISNNFFGNLAGEKNTTGNTNNFFGASAGRNNTSGGSNNFFGNGAGASNTTAGSNNFFGLSAGTNNTTGAFNNIFGHTAGFNNTTGSRNVFIGSSVDGNRTGDENVFIGNNAARNSRSGSANIAIGTSSLSNSTDTLSGSNNIAIGSGAIQNIRFGASQNVGIGYSVFLPTANASNQGVYQNVLFFTGASGTGTTIAAGSRAGIKTNAPNRDFEVAGEVRITDLTTDAPTRIVGADADGDLGQMTAGNGISFPVGLSTIVVDTSVIASKVWAGTISGDTARFIERKDTAAMLLPYLLKKDTAAMLTTYISNADTATMLSTYISNADTAGMLNTYISAADTAGMLNPYLLKRDTAAMLSTYISNADTAGMLSTYISNADTATMLSTYISNADTAGMLTTYISAADTAVMLSSYISATDTSGMLNAYLRKADTLAMLSSYISAADTSAMLNPYLLKKDTAAMLSTYIANSDTAAMLSAYISVADTAAMLSTYISNADTAGMLSTYISNADTATMLTTYISNADTASILNSYLKKSQIRDASANGYLSKYSSDTTLNKSSIFQSGSNIGIGTITPGSALQVNGGASIGYSASTAAATNGLTVRGATQFDTVVNINNATPAWLQFSGKNTLTSDNTNAYLQTPSLSGAIQFRNSSPSQIGSLSSTGLIIGDGSPAKKLHVVGEARITDLDNGTATKIVGATNDGDLDEISIGSGLTLSSGTLSATAVIADTTVRERQRHYFSITIFRQKDTVTNNFENADIIVVPPDLGGWCIRSMNAKAFTVGAGASTSIELKVDGTTQATLTGVGTHQFLTPQNISIASGSIISLKTVSLTGTLVGLTATIQIQKTCN